MGNFVGLFWVDLIDFLSPPGANPSQKRADLEFS